MNNAMFILFVEDQDRSAVFYSVVLGGEPAVHVPGMTEFALPGGASLGLMPSAGIKRLLGAEIPDPASAHGIPRSEVYLPVDNPIEYLDRAVQEGGQLISPVTSRDWGDRAGYCLDPDGHLLAFAEAIE